MTREEVCDIVCANVPPHVVKYAVTECDGRIKVSLQARKPVADLSYAQSKFYVTPEDSGGTVLESLKAAVAKLDKFLESIGK